MSATAAAAFQVATAAMVTGVGLAFLAYVTGTARYVLITAGVVAFLILAPVTVPIAWNILYRKPPVPKRRPRHQAA